MIVFLYVWDGVSASILLVDGCLFVRDERSFKVDKSCLVLLLIEFEDTSVQIEVLHIEDVLVIVAMCRHMLQISSIHWFVHVYR